MKGRGQFRILFRKYGQEFRVVNKREATSQKFFYCGSKGSKKELNVRIQSWLNCSTFHDCDINAAINILNTLTVETVFEMISKVETVETNVLENPVKL